MRMKKRHIKKHFANIQRKSNKEANFYKNRPERRFVSASLDQLQSQLWAMDEEDEKSGS